MYELLLCDIPAKSFITSTKPHTGYFGCGKCTSYSNIYINCIKYWNDLPIEIEMWKATEFRLFLLYTRPLVLKDVIPTRYYEHFLKLTVATRILCSPKLHIMQNQC